MRDPINLIEPLDLDRAKKLGGYLYLGSPYSKYPHGIEAAHREVCEAAAWLIGRGLPVYSPIAHTHPVAVHGDIDPYDHDVWLPADQPLMDGASGLIICKMETWQDSRGLMFEIDAFRAAGKPVFGMEWPE